MASNTMKITEKYEYLTDIITSYDGTEQRLKLRQYPRHYLTYDYSAMDKYQAQYLKGLVRARQTDMWWVPMWHNVSHLREDFVAGGDALTIYSKYLYNFDECDYITIHIKDDVVDENAYNITRQVRRYTDTQIQLIGEIRKRLDKASTWIYPLRKCILQPTVGFNYVYSNGAEVALTFEDLNVKSKIHIPTTYRFDYEDIEGQYNRWNIPEIYNELEVFFIEPRWKEDEDVQLKVDKNTQRIDNETGIFLYDLKNTHSYDTQSYVFLFETQQKINNMIKFFKRMCGRYKSFYMPTWVNDFEVTRDIVAGQNSIYTDYKKMYKFYAGNTKQKYLIIFMKNWQVYIYPIMTFSYETLSNESGKVRYGRIILQETISTSIPMESILMCSFLNLVRFDDDSLTIEYETNCVARVELTVKEVDK